MHASTTQLDPPPELAAREADVGARIGRYIILGRLGAGSMGVVYRAYDEALDRRVALKLLRAPGARDDQARARLVREAKAMAQLSHPNVVQVYDVGEWAGLDFIALEFVQGMTLRTWLSEQPRTWQEICKVFAQAGRGLAAAHAAGLVHRDFKPDNVLIGAEGRVLVADFGLARAAESEVPEHETPSAARSNPSLAGMTVLGSLIGTPAYMAPEQFMRTPADARSDQFSFCLALHEALFGQRPFAGESVDDIRKNVLLGRMVATPVLTRVPQWLQELTRRGLNRQPARRFASMHALLAELDRVRGRRRRLAVGVAAFLVGLGGLVAWPSAQVCRGATDNLAGVWGAPERDALRDAFLATDLSFATDTWTLTVQALDEYAADWSGMHEEACLAHHHGEQSDFVLDLRMLCLQRRRTEMKARVDVLRGADAQAVIHAVDAVRALQPVATCADPAQLLNERQRLGEPRDPALAARVHTLRSKLAQVEALEQTGQLQRGLALSAEAVREAQALDYPPVLAEALFFRGSLLATAGQASAAESELWRAIVTATRSGHELIQARAMVKDIDVLVHERQNFWAASRMADSAGALVDRIAADSPLAGELRNNLAVLRFQEGRHVEAEALHLENLEFRRRILPAAHPDIAMTLGNLGVDLQELRRYDEAGERIRESIVVFRDSVGARHPHTLQSETNLAIVLFDHGKHDEARALLSRSLAAWMAIIGDDTSNTAEQQCIAGLLDLEAGDIAGGLKQLRRAHQLGERWGHPAARHRTRLSLAQALWQHEPAARAEALELARAAEHDAILLHDPIRRDAARSWRLAHEAVSLPLTVSSAPRGSSSSRRARPAPRRRRPAASRVPPPRTRRRSPLARAPACAAH